MAHILIVDDCRDLLELSTDLLESAGHKVTARANGAEGLSSLRSEPLPDCVLLDVEMPVLSGPGMAEEMRSQEGPEESIPIVLVSSRADLAEIAERIGTPYFLAKATPQYGRVLLEVLDRVLHDRGLRRRLRARSHRPTLRWASRISALLTTEATEATETGRVRALS